MDGTFQLKSGDRKPPKNPDQQQNGIVGVEEKKVNSKGDNQGNNENENTNKKSSNDTVSKLSDWLQSASLNGKDSSKIVDPLLFDRKEIIAPDFTPERFITQYARVGVLDDVKRDLHRLQRLLRSNAVEAISRDFPSFVNLTIKLSSLGHETQLLREPLLDNRSNLIAIDNGLSIAIKKVENALEDREAAKRQKTKLQLFLKIHHSIQKLDSILEDKNGSNENIFSENKADDSVSTNFMGRIVSEYAQLKYMIDNAGNSAFIKQLQPKIKGIKNILAGSLTDALSSALRNVYIYCKDKDSFNQEKARGIVSEFIQIIRVTVFIDRPDELVSVFISELVKNQFLGQEENIKYFSVDKPRTDDIRGSAQIELGKFFGSVISFLSTCSPILNLVEIIMGKRGRRAILLQTFDNIIRLIIQSAPQIFNCSKLDAFHSNYNMSKDFILSFENIYTRILPDNSSENNLLIANFDIDINTLSFGSNSSEYSQNDAGDFSLRNSTIYTTFMDKWSFSVYFQLRMKQVTDKIDNVFSSVSINSSDNLVIFEQDTDQLKFQQSYTLLLALDFCWRESIFLNELTHKFWELSLKLLIRYQLWVQTTLSNNNLSVYKDEKTGKFVLSNSEGNKSSLNNAHLFIYSDIKIIENVVNTTLLDRIFEIIKPASGENLLPEDRNLLRETIGEILKAIDSLLPTISENICGSITNKSIEYLKVYVPKIPSLYRMTNREAPTTPSQFISLVVEPIKTLTGSSNLDSSKQEDIFTDVISLVPESIRVKWAIDISNDILEFYSTVVNDILINVSKFEAYNSKKRSKKLNASGKAGSSENLDLTENTQVTDDNKIRYQLYLDVFEVGRQISFALHIKEAKEELALDSETIVELKKLLPSFAKLEDSVKEFSLLVN